MSEFLKEALALRAEMSAFKAEFNETKKVLASMKDLLISLGAQKPQNGRNPRKGELVSLEVWKRARYSGGYNQVPSRTKSSLSGLEEFS